MLIIPWTQHLSNEEVYYKMEIKKKLRYTIWKKQLKVLIYNKERILGKSIQTFLWVSILQAFFPQNSFRKFLSSSQCTTLILRIKCSIFFKYFMSDCMGTCIPYQTLSENVESDSLGTAGQLKMKLSVKLLSDNFYQIKRIKEKYIKLWRKINYYKTSRKDKRSNSKKKGNFIDTYMRKVIKKRNRII